IHRLAKPSSPLTHVQRITCPVFLFHASDDSNVPVAESQRFAQLLRSTSKSVEYVEVLAGNHYDSMIQQGIPRAIPWLKQLAGMNESNARPSIAQDASTTKPNASVPSVPQVGFPNVPQNSNPSRQASGRVVTFRFQSFGGHGDPKAAARQAL